MNKSTIEEHKNFVRISMPCNAVNKDFKSIIHMDLYDVYVKKKQTQ